MTGTRVPTEQAQDHIAQIKIASFSNLLAGLWIIASPWVYGAKGGVTGNGVIFGILIVLLAGIRLTANAPTWPSWVNFIFGLWMMITPWIFGVAGVDTGFLWNSVIVGAIVAILSLWSALAGTERGETGTPNRR